MELHFTFILFIEKKFRMSFRAESGPTLDGADEVEKSGHEANKVDFSTSRPLGTLRSK
jgi:hypothetical protein